MVCVHTQHLLHFPRFLSPGEMVPQENSAEHFAVFSTGSSYSARLLFRAFDAGRVREAVLVAFIETIRNSCWVSLKYLGFVWRHKFLLRLLCVVSLSFFFHVCSVVARGG